MYETQIKAGIHFLEQEEGITDWRERLAGECIVMMNGCNCVIGHLFGDYDTFMSRRNYTVDWARRHGFFLTCADVPGAGDMVGSWHQLLAVQKHYKILGDEWEAAIRNDLTAEATTSPVPDYVPVDLIAADTYLNRYRLTANRMPVNTIRLAPGDWVMDRVPVGV